MKPLCIYHGACDDGFAAAWAVRKALGDVEFFPGVYQKEPPPHDGRDVIFVDFSYKRPVLDAMGYFLSEDEQRTIVETLRFPAQQKPSAARDLAEELREYTAMKYAGDCKCGKCQLVPRALVERIYHTLNGTSLPPHDSGSPSDIRALGWTVAVHNDYSLDGVPHTFWLFTKDGRAIKGEGVTDADALQAVRALIHSQEVNAQPMSFGMNVSAEQFDEIVAILEAPGEPSEVIRQGAELLRKLRAER